LTCADLSHRSPLIHNTARILSLVERAFHLAPRFTLRRKCCIAARPVLGSLMRAVAFVLIGVASSLCDREPVRAYDAIVMPGKIGRSLSMAVTHPSVWL